MEKKKPIEKTSNKRKKTKVADKKPPVQQQSNVDPADLEGLDLGFSKDSVKQEKVAKEEQQKVAKDPALTEFEVGPPLIFHKHGNLFDSEAALIVVPRDAAGKMLPDNESFLASQYSFSPGEIPKEPLGTVIFREVSHSTTQQLAFATSTQGKGSQLEEIKNIAKTISDWINDHPDIRTIAFPLLGTGAGQLEIRNVYPLLVKTLLKNINTSPQLTLYSLNEEVVERLNQLHKAFFKQRISSFDSDTVDEKEDQLDITFDVDSFAYLIANHNVKPPLSIGLFGLWGSGKSFFMQKMYEKIELIQNLDKQSINPTNGNADIVFCKNIVQIKFNAWYYVDANLWACLVSTIFERIGNAIGLLTEDEKKIQELEEELNERKKALRLIELERSNIQKKISRIEVGIKLEEKVIGSRDEDLKVEKKELEKELEVKKNEEKKLNEARQLLESNLKLTLNENLTRKNLYEKLESTKQLIAEARQQKYDILHLIEQVELEIQSIEETRNENETNYNKQVLKYVAEDSKNKEAFNQLKDKTKQYLKLEDAGKSEKELTAFFQEVLLFREEGISLYTKLKGWSWKDIGILLLLISLALLITFVVSLVEGKEVVVLLAGIGSAITALSSWISKYLGYGWKYLKDLRSFTHHVDNYRQQMEQMKTHKLQRLKEDQIRQTERLQQAKKELHQYQMNVAEIENNIEKLRRGESIDTFIEKRLQSDDYQKYMGLISLIRSDFNQLSTYIREITGEINENKNIDRIVLYIDDLDRCPPEKVVEVLQAIHLLLSFPLFVVVVGVDSRWISKSLINKYGYMISPFDTEGKQTDIALQYKDGATPYDYLEKIFQIPFRLTPIETQGKIDYIRSLIHEDLEIEKLENAAASTPDSGENNTAEGGEQISQTEPPSNTGTYHFQPTAENLRIRKVDFDVIQQLAPVLGTSPRAVKRFVNIFRLIKANAKWALLKTPIEQRRAGALLLLSVIIGSPAFAPWLFKELKAGQKVLFSDLLIDFHDRLDDLEKIWGAKATAEYKLFNEFFTDLDHFALTQTFNNLLIEDLQELAVLVSRFSFRVED